MKKIVISALSMSAILMMASCTKDYECNCVDNTGVEPLLPPTSTSYSGLSKSEAEDIENQCETTTIFDVYTCTFEEK
jgi:hypothetical protein